MSQRTTIFVSYSQKDKKWLERLQVYLKPYDRRGVLTLWDDTKIGPGDQWRSEIRAAIDRAAASVLLISPTFLASDFIEAEELPPLLRKAEKGGAKILSLFVRPVKLTKHPELARFQALNSPERPLSTLRLPQAEKVLAEVADRLEQVLTASQPPQPARFDATETSLDVFQHLQSAAIGLSILTALAAPDQQTSDYTLTELTKALDIDSRKSALAALEQLSKAGWIEKRRLFERTSYRISDEGIRQLKNLSAVADGPFRQAVSR